MTLRLLIDRNLKSIMFYLHSIFNSYQWHANLFFSSTSCLHTIISAKTDQLTPLGNMTGACTPLGNMTGACTGMVHCFWHSSPGET